MHRGEGSKPKLGACHLHQEWSFVSRKVWEEGLYYLHLKYFILILI